MSIIYRQGDVLLMKQDALPANAALAQIETDRIVLAYGEVTGHAHALSTSHARLYLLGNETFVEVREGATLRHEEHAPILLDQGVYKVVRQREYSPISFEYVEGMRLREYLPEWYQYVND